jgi:DNA/RNA-binding domain of Phe-tRNA-synthetase-like protein
MYYEVSKEIFEKLPTACFGAVAVRGLDNTHKIPELEALLEKNIGVCEAYFADKKPKETEDILPYREAFRALNINPNKFLCSIEALLTRIAKKKGFPAINAAVDLGNAISIQYHLPIGAHDLDTIENGLDVRLAQPGDTFVAFGSTEVETPDEGEAVYASGHEVRTRRWTWRQSEVGKITEDTKAILFPIDGFSDVNEPQVREAIETFRQLLQQYFGCEAETGFVDAAHPRFEFFQ